jgi:hypothetical protein
MRKQSSWKISSAIAVLLTASLVPAGLSASKETKLTPQELVAHHLDSLGPAAARAAVKSRVAQGVGRLRMLVGGHADMSGPAITAAEGSKEMFLIDFNFKQYPREALGYDGQKIYAPRVVADSRTRLGDFLNTYDQIFREGLLGGTLSTAWALLNLESHQAELKSAGMKKVEGKEVYRLDYRPKRGAGDLKISLYFDAETYRHVMTTYDLSSSAPIGSGPDLDAFSGARSTQSAGQLPTRYKLQETFSDFRTVDDLTLPAHWNIQLTTEQGAKTSIWEWDMTFKDIMHNRAIDPKLFELSQ